MPLALELAASWVHVLSPAHIADELRHNLDLLRTDVRNIPERHRNIRATFDLSISRLTEREREIFLRLAVFDGEFTRDAAEAVTGATLPLLLRLVNQSLLRTTDGAYSLHQLVKQYALTALPDDNPTFAAHSTYYLDWLTQQENDLKGHNQPEAHQRIGQNIANVRAAHAYAIQQADVQRLMRVAELLTIFFENRSTPDDAIRMLRDTLPLVEGAEHGRILLLMGWLKTVNGEPDAGLDYLRRGRTLLATAEDYHAAAMSLALFSWFEAADELDFDALRTMYTDHATADPTRWQRGWFLYGLGNTLKVLGQQEAALNTLRECERVFHEVGDHWAVTWALGALATLLRQMEQWHMAAEVYRRSYAICEELHDIGGQIHALIGLSDIALAQHNYREALSLNHHILTHIAGNRIYSANVNFAITGIARAFDAQGDGIRAVEMLTTLRGHPMFESVLRQHERREIDNQLAKLRKGLPEDDFQQATQRGAAMTVTDLANMLLDELATTAEPFSANPSPLVDPLTDREQEVLALLAEGRSNRDIADALVIALGTAKTHVHNISSKLNARNRGEAVARARQLGLID
jgi:ATP/maltotriose-dependent transcriptional regulator MalT